MRALSNCIAMSILRQGDGLGDSELSRMLGKGGSFHIVGGSRHQHAVRLPRTPSRIDEDGETSSLTTILEQVRERLANEDFLNF